jgi:hypothetical protein
MPDIALYYPYTHVRDETWLKAAALYWPKLAVIAVPDYPRNLTPTAKVLRDELGFFVDVDPSPQVHRLAEPFLEFVRREGAELRRRYAYLRLLPSELKHGPWSTSVPPDWGSNRIAGPPPGHYREGNRLDVGGVAWVAMFRVFRPLAEELVRQGLGVWNEDRSWIGMRPRLADVYLTALAERLAVANDMPAITDRPNGYGVTNGWDVDALARALLADEVEDRPTARESAEVAAKYAAVAISTVVPGGLQVVDAKQVVRARRVLAEEFFAFRAHLDSLTNEFAEIASIESPEVLHARLQVLVERDLRARIRDLERGLRRLGFEPTRAVLGLKSLELPPIAGAAAAGLGASPVVGQAGLVAAQVVASSVRAHHVAEQQRRSAAGYLLGLREELDPQGVLDHLRRTLRRAGRTSRKRRWWRRAS